MAFTRPAVFSRGRGPVPTRPSDDSALANVSARARHTAIVTIRRLVEFPAGTACKLLWLDPESCPESTCASRAQIACCLRDTIPSYSYPLSPAPSSQLTLRGGCRGGQAHLRSWQRSAAAAAEFASFTWPITSLDELHRLLASEHLKPTWLLLGDFTGAWAERVELDLGVTVLCVDRRQPLRPGIAFCGDFHLVLPIRRWACVCAWPTCTHSARSNGPLLQAKALDGRMFWGLVGVLYVLLAGQADARMVEQPLTTLGLYFRWAFTKCLTLDFGDSMKKTICLYFVRAHARGLAAYHRAPRRAIEARPGPWRFDDDEARDRHRSSWAHYPLFLLALAACLCLDEEAAECPPTYEEGVEQLAVAWHRAGWPVPEGYYTLDGLPPTAEGRAYQQEHGRGHGGRLPGVVPRSLRTPPPVDAVVAAAALARIAAGTALPSDEVTGSHVVSRGVAAPLALPPDAAHVAATKLIFWSALTAQGFTLFFVSTMVRPLVYAHLSGLQVLGAELPLTSPRSTALRLALQWSTTAWGAVAAASTYMIGRYRDGPRVAVAVLPFTPADRDIAATNDRRLLKLREGATMAWMTFAALSSCVVGDVVARVLVGVDAVARPVAAYADALPGDPAAMSPFRVGAFAATHLAPTARLLLAQTPVDRLLQRDASNAGLLMSAILAKTGPDAAYLEGWVERIRPPEIDLRDELAALLPDFSDRRIISQHRFPPSYKPPTTTWLPRAPPQQPRLTPFCVRSPIELLRHTGQRRLHSWLTKALDQLLCIERGEPNCELMRPHPLAIGQGALHKWARGVVWDFTFERAACAVPLDFTLPIESGLDLPYLRDRLQGYPDQRAVSFILEGVRFEADVELHAVLVPHLISLPNGFASVRKELYRLESNSWYRFFDHLPFWPIYLNGQGATTRKLEDRWRRTTECGGPRKCVLDETGLRALSINEASQTRHFPRHFADRLHEPSFRAWLAAKELLDPATRGGPSPWPREEKPTLRMVMAAITILLGAAELLGEPIYVFGDDAKDYFNQLALSSEDWAKMGVIFLHAEEVGGSGVEADPASRLFFVSERRLGFGAKPSSNIAQRFSEILLAFLRADMDAAEAAVPPDNRPTAREWRRLRTALPPDLHDPEAQLRLYFVVMYTDDPLMVVVGVERALRLLRCWHLVCTRVGLLMAIPEKRNLGTWAPWLGVLICAGLGLVIVPKAKLLRTSARLLDTLTSRTDFQEYRSLIGMLEHLRCVNCAPAACMYGLYGPHRSESIRNDGPSAPIRVNAFMAAQLERWIKLLASTGGAPVSAALRRAATLPSTLTYVISSDAATDSDPPGMGGFCHGLYWQLTIKPEWLVWLHITALEMLATGGSTMAFRQHAASAERILLQSDSLATPSVLAAQKSKSAALALIHSALLDDPAYTDIAERALIAHLDGDSNPFADYVSRSLWERFFALCRAVGVRPVWLPAPPALINIIERAVASAKALGQPVRVSTYARADPVLPNALLALGRRTPACEEADAVSDLLWARLAGGQEPLAPPTKRQPSSPATGGARATSVPASDRLWSRLTETSEPAASEATPRPTSVNLGAHASRLTTALDGKARAAIPLRGVVKRGEHLARSLHTTVVGGVRVLQLPTGALRHTDLRMAAHLCASRRAGAFAKAGLASNRGIDELTRLLQHAADLNDYGSASGTRAKDETAWAHWCAFAELIGFEPILTASQVREHPSEVGTLLATFLLYIYPKMKGRKGRQWAKPRSAFAYVLAIIRIFRGWKLLLPPAKVVKGELHGLLRAFVNVYGVAALMPSRREPMKYAMVRDIQNVTTARLGGINYDAASPLGVATRGILAVGWRTGHRLAEFVAHPSGETMHITRGNVSYIIGGVTVHDPTVTQLKNLQPGDVILVHPPRSKTDQFGEIHCPFPSSLPFSYDKGSAGYIIQQIELTRPCTGTARDLTPLFADANGAPFTHAVLDQILHRLLISLYGEKVASCYSWHSLRIGLATALKAANVPDDVIQMICRWANPESLRAYARHGQSLHIDSVDRAERAIIDAIQSASVPKVCNSEGAAGLHLAFGGTISARARAVLDAADDAEGVTGIEEIAPPNTSPLPTSTACVGRRVLVPRATWPADRCDENDARGWTAHIVNFTATRSSAIIRFAHATDARGLPYADHELRLSSLLPL